MRFLEILTLEYTPDEMQRNIPGNKPRSVLFVPALYTFSLNMESCNHKYAL